jgi:arsenate reductase (thioredoxin)
MKRVMFVCKRNSCRSQMAEGWAKLLGNGKIMVTSSGLEASRVHPQAIEIMAEVGVNISGQTSDPLSNFKAADFDIVISLCGCGVNLPQEWVLREVFEDWQLEDPDGKSLAIFREVRDKIKEKVTNLINNC